MTPEVQLWRPPEGAEILAVPRELEIPRGQIIHMAAHLMKLYGIRRVSCKLSLVGPCGVTSPEFELMPAFEALRPLALQATEVTVIRAIVPMLLAFGILGMSITLNDQDKNDMLKLWSSMAALLPAAPEAAAQQPVVIAGEGHGN